MLPPTMAMALVRTSSRVKSASKAVTAADTAPRPLQAAPNEQASQVGGCSGPKTAQGKNHQAQHDDALATKTVRGHAKRQLQRALRQTINAHGQAQPQRVFTAGVAARLQGKDRQHQKQTQHAQRKNADQRGAGAALGGRHVQCTNNGIRRRIGHKRTQKTLQG
jgi:hypothetical protein